MGAYQDMIDRGRRLVEEGNDDFSLNDDPPRQEDFECVRAFESQDRDTWVNKVEEMFSDLPEGFFDVEIIG